MNRESARRLTESNELSEVAIVPVSQTPSGGAGSFAHAWAAHQLLVALGGAVARAIGLLGL